VDSVFIHKVWEEQELSKMTTSKGVPFPMLADAGGKLGTIYGVYDESAGVNVRGTFLIDPDGIVQSYEVLSPAVGRNPSEHLRQIQAYQFVRESKGAQATPAGWAPGQEALSPDPDLVGNIWKVWQPK